MSRNAAFELATVLEEPEFFTVDGKPYKLLGVDHLSTGEEAKIMHVFGAYEEMTKEFSAATSDKDIEEKGAALIEMRMKILTTMTDMPLDVARRLPLSGQIKLMTYFNEMLGEDS